MPNRIIKETIRTSRNINALSDFLFRIWVYLITYVDDYGRGSADAQLLKGFVFPRKDGLTEHQITEALEALASRGMIQLYEHDGEPYFCFPKWTEHQQIRAKKSKFPAPDIIGYQMISDDIKCPRNPIQSESESESESSASTTRVCAREDTAAADEDLSRVMTFYIENISMNVPSSLVTAAIMDFVSDLSAEVVLHAMEIAAEGDKHDWRYVKAILERYKASGFKTLEAVKADEARARRTKGRVVETPEYTDNPFEGWDEL